MKGQETIGSIVASATGESAKTRAQALGGIDKYATTGLVLNGQDYSDSQIGEMLGYKILQSDRQAQAWKGTTAGTGAEQTAKQLREAAAKFRALSKKEEALQIGQATTKEFDETVQIDMADLSARLARNQENTTELNNVSDALAE